MNQTRNKIRMYQTRARRSKGAQRNNFVRNMRNQQKFYRQLVGLLKRFKNSQTRKTRTSTQRKSYTFRSVGDVNKAIRRVTIKINGWRRSLRKAKGQARKWFFVNIRNQTNFRRQLYGLRKRFASRRGGRTTTTRTGRSSTRRQSFTFRSASDV
jgi:predicted phage tail protein